MIIQAVLFSINAQIPSVCVNEGVFVGTGTKVVGVNDGADVVGDNEGVSLGKSLGVCEGDNVGACVVEIINGVSVGSYVEGLLLGYNVGK